MSPTPPPEQQPGRLLSVLGLAFGLAGSVGGTIGAGIYNLVQPEEAAALGTIKAADLTATGAEIVASANIGCSLQLRRHLNPELRVAHPIQLLAEAARTP